MEGLSVVATGATRLCAKVASSASEWYDDAASTGRDLLPVVPLVNLPLD
jgi:hypothetical protein